MLSFVRCESYSMFWFHSVKPCKSIKIIPRHGKIMKMFYITKAETRFLSTPLLLQRIRNCLNENTALRCGIKSLCFHRSSVATLQWMVRFKRFQTAPVQVLILFKFKIENRSPSDTFNCVLFSRTCRTIVITNTGALTFVCRHSKWWHSSDITFAERHVPATALQLTQHHKHDHLTSLLRVCGIFLIGSVL